MFVLSRGEVFIKFEELLFRNSWKFWASTFILQFTIEILHNLRLKNIEIWTKYNSWNHFHKLFVGVTLKKFSNLSSKRRKKTDKQLIIFYTQLLYENKTPKIFFNIDNECVDFFFTSYCQCKGTRKQNLKCELYE